MLLSEFLSLVLVIRLSSLVLGGIFVECRQYPKVEHSYETVGKPKWCKAKKPLPLIYMEKFGSQTPNPLHTHCLYFIHHHETA